MKKFSVVEIKVHGTLVLSLESPTIKLFVKMTSENQILSLTVTRYSVI